ncbi:hypothetical protein HNQ34_001768 [Anoxybacillus tepidamans]|uniref:Phage protein n=1 Tax=Anoxybacteroides tepidamans TaxID=265948 RepID=A0A7W8IQ72_9BACL|nr:hypothetical protein [Anoxybacillus tepidamans]MBB5324670.1 hypothetical protein [Anoxybacillus tepidamans]
MMCKKCYGKGYAVKEVIPGAFAYTPCDCEHAQLARQQAEEEMSEFRKRLREAKERLKMEVSG